MQIIKKTYINYEMEIDEKKNVNNNKNIEKNINIVNIGNKNEYKIQGINIEINNKYQENENNKNVHNNNNNINKNIIGNIFNIEKIKDKIIWKN